MSASASAICATLVFAACSGPVARIEIERSGPRKPSWANGNVPEPGASYYFLGTALGAPSLEEGRKRAMDAALKQAADYVGVAVGTRQESTARALIQGALQDEIYTERTRRFEAGITLESWDIYLLVRVRRDALEAGRRPVNIYVEQSLDGIVALVEESRTLLAAGRPLAALLRANTARNRLDKLPRGTSQRRATLEAAVRRALDGARQQAGFTSLVVAPDRSSVSAFRDGLDAAISAKGFAAVAPPEAVSRDRIERIAQGGAFDIGSLGKGTALAVVCVLNIEPGGQVLGQRAAYLHVSGSVVSVSDGKTFLRISGKTREFGATLVDAVRKAAATLGRSVAADVLRRVTNGAGTESP